MMCNTSTNRVGQAGAPRQLAFVALCSLALVLAAFAAPPSARGASPPDVPLLDLFGNQSQETGDCVVTLSGEPVPGRNVTVTVSRRGEPADGVGVWFNGRSVGPTDRSGQIEGRVPYVETLQIRVALSGGGSCEFVAGTDDRTGIERRTGNPPRSGAEARVVRNGPAVPSVATGPNSAPAAQRAQDGNVTGTYTVHDTIDVRIEGRPDPGATVTLVATIQDDPVPNATVTVAGSDVGTTDESGRAAFRIPDDGSSTVTVGVQRGELRSQRRIDVRLLRVAVRGDRLPLPGQSATVEATLGEDPAGDAVVMLDGERFGTTDPSGRLQMRLPADPTSTVTVATGDRTARTSLLSVFAPTILTVGGVLSLLLGGPIVAYWIGGRRGLGVLVGLGANAVTAVAGYLVAGPNGVILAVLATVLVLALALIVRRPAVAADVGESTGDALEGFVARVTGDALWLTRRIEEFLDQIRATLTATVHDLRRRDPRSIAVAFWGRTTAIPGYLVAGLVAALTRPRRILAALRSQPATDGSDDTVRRDSSPSDEDAGSTVRALWRPFARAVVSERWPQRTPGEVSRRAVDAGLPSDPVVELTTVFRDVEYGGRSLSDERYRRARAALDALGIDGDDDGSSGTATGDVTTGSAAADDAGESATDPDDDSDDADTGVTGS